jgi:hypothetical protein
VPVTPREQQHGEETGLAATSAARSFADAAARAGAVIMPLSGDGGQAPKDARAPSRAAGDGGVRGAHAFPQRFFLSIRSTAPEFIEKRRDFTVNIALIEDGRPTFGLVYAPARALLAVTTEPGKAVAAELPPNEAGADFGRLARKPLRARPVPASGLTALVSHSHLDPETEAFLAKLKIAECSGIGSAVKFLSIAGGEADVYPRFGPTMEWDTAAGQAVLEAAGGRVVGTDGEPLRYGKTGQGLRRHRLGQTGARTCRSRHLNRPATSRADAVRRRRVARTQTPGNHESQVSRASPPALLSCSPRRQDRGGAEPIRLARARSMVITPRPYSDEPGASP